MEYPDIDNPRFQQLIAGRLEFRDLHNVDGLYPHQEFVRRFMSPYTPYKSLILYHSLGSGKSIACIAVAVDHHLHDGRRCVIVTKGDSGTSNFVNQILMYLEMSESGKQKKWDMSMFTMKHYIALSNQVNSMSDDDIIGTFSDTIIILDEVHNVRYLKKVVESSVYGSIIRVLRLCSNVKIIIATATPMTDNHEQVNSLLGICNYFRDNPLDYRGIISYNNVVQDRPESEYMGTDEYVPGVRVWASDMIGHQMEVYSLEDTDKPPEDIYRKLTHISLFCFEDGTHGKEVTESKMSKTKVLKTITSMSTKQTRDIRYIKYSVKPEFSASLVGEGLRRSSSKYDAVIDLLEESDGKVFIFLEEVKGSGLLLLASVLEHHGYELYLGDSMDNMAPKRRYTMCVGSSDICPNNNDRLEGFNCEANKTGSYVRVLLGSRVIGESITLKNVRQFYCLTPHWNDSTVEQAIGRVIRNKSHDSLDEEQRRVEIYIHASIFPDKPYNSVDIKKLLKCKEKEKDILEVSRTMIDNAVEMYCGQGSPVPVTHVDTFAAAYIHHREYGIAKSIFRVMRYSERPCDIRHLSSAINVHPTVCNEVLCRIILSNASVGTGFVRAYGDTVFMVEDPSTPYVMMPASHRLSGNEPRELAGTELAPIWEKLADTGFPNIVETFRYMQTKSKASFLEYCVQKGKGDALEQIGTAYASIGKTPCHLLLYRDLENSYTSSNPVPKKPMGKTRAFDGKSWYTVGGREEQEVFEAYRALVYSMLEDADRMLSIYGVISAIDGEMRLRLRGTEDTSKSFNDRRYVKRGKNMRSIKKEHLMAILHHVSDAVVDDGTPINHIVKLIDRSLVNAGLYIIV